MTRFDQFVARHGEAAAQAIIEMLERLEKIRAENLSLEERWNYFMSTDDAPTNQAA